MVMIRATIAKNAKRKAKHKSTLGELPNRTAVFLKNMSDQQISGYGIIPGATSVAASNSWSYCNLLDAKSYGMFGDDLSALHNNVSPATAIYAWRRQA